MEVLISQLHQVDTDGLTSLPSSSSASRRKATIPVSTSTSTTIIPPEMLNPPPQQNKRKAPSTVESRLENKKMISNVRSKRCKKHIHRTKSSKTLRQGLTTKGKASRGFWSKSKQDISKKLWWPTKTDWRASASNSSSGLLNLEGRLSSFSVKTKLHTNRSCSYYI